jgi:hypothetical protein
MPARFQPLRRITANIEHTPDSEQHRRIWIVYSVDKPLVKRKRYPMKTAFKLLCSALFCVISVQLYAQAPSLKNLEQIAASDREAYRSLTKPHASQIVNNYDLRYHRFYWFTDPALAYIRGAVTSYFVPTQPMMSSIQFELASGMSADSAFHSGFKYEVNHTGDVITIPFGEVIPEGSLDSVTVYYHGNPTTSGFGSFGNGVHGGAPGMWTLSEPFGASDWWPSKNDLTDKIDSIDVFVVTPNGNHVASNGLLISETPFGVNYTLAHWKHRYPIASYLIAIASTNYSRFTDYYIKGQDTLSIQNYVYPEDSASIRERAATVLPSMALFEELFTPYPFWNEKYGQAQFGWGGGMEHQTMTFLGGEQGGAFNHEVIAHELAHQWVGDMITCGSWQDIWLNEGFATYFAGLTYEHLFNGYYWPIWKHNNISYVCYAPAGSVYCTDTTSVNRIFDGRLSYSKGAMLLHQLRWVIGDEFFFTGLKNYLEDPKLKMGFARTADFKAHMEAVCGRDLTWYFDDWFYGQGFPTYQVSISEGTDQSAVATLYQTQSHPSVSFFELPVPIRFYGGGRDTTLVFDNTFSGQSFTFSPGFSIDSAKFDPDLWLISDSSMVSLGIPDLPAGRHLTLMPNPVDDVLWLEHDLGRISALTVTGMDGKQFLVSHPAADTSPLKVDVGKLGPGIYLLRIDYPDGTVVRKFVVR